MYNLIHFRSRTGPIGREFAYRFIPFYFLPTPPSHNAIPYSEAVELSRLITLDALTPWYDSPMTTDTLKTILADEGFAIEHLEDRLVSPVYTTARKSLDPLPVGRPSDLAGDPRTKKGGI